MDSDNRQRQIKDVPWSSMGRDTPLSRAGRSLVAVGPLPFEPAAVRRPGDPLPQIGSEHPDFEKYLMEIVGTAIQVGEGKLVTCAHVIDAVNEAGRRGHLLARSIEGNISKCIFWPYENVIRYIDFRHEKQNPAVDLAVIMVAYPEQQESYDAPVIRWGDSTRLGVGDQVVVGGYPYGTELFRLTETNRGIVQPTFYPGIVSAILPATSPGETRLIQVSAAVAGGISGGALLDPKSGAMLGMVTSGLTGQHGDLHPVTYALPSEIIAPFVSALNFSAGGRTVGKEPLRDAKGRPLKDK